ncbi:MAG TPA: hypothetical protein VI112_04405 [Bacteroidia bacterium]|jgi:hypothetical protein
MKPLLSILLLFLIACSSGFVPQVHALHNGKLEDGIYLVGTVNKSGYFTKINPDFLDSADMRTGGVVLDTDEYVPIRLSAPPDTAYHEERNNTKLMLNLTKASGDDLERFTGKYLGHRVAIVIGGQVTTMHGIKAKITGGKLQITRCTDNACEKLYFELKDNVEEKK